MSRVFDGDTVDVPVGVAVRSWGPTDDVFVLYELHVVDMVADSSELWLQDFDCPTATCGDTTHDFGAAEELVSTLGTGQPLGPSMAIRRANGSTAPLELQVTMNGRADGDAPYCGHATVDYDDITDLFSPAAANIDLLYRKWTGTFGTPNTASMSAVTIVDSTPALAPSSTSVCEDRDRSQVRAGATGKARVCWRFANIPTGAYDQVACADEFTVGSGYFTARDTAPTTGQTNPLDQDHVSLEATGGRMVAHHSRESSQDGIRVYFPDTSGTPSVRLDLGVDVNEPDIVTDSLNHTHVVYQEGVGSTAKIWMRTCSMQDATAPAACPVLANWAARVQVATGDRVRYPHLATDGNRQFVMFMQDIDSTSNQRNRVKVATRCAGDLPTAWTVSDVKPLAAPENVERDQATFWGKPPIALNRVDNILHVVFVEADDMVTNTDLPGESDVWWGRMAYTDCP